MYSAFVRREILEEMKDRKNSIIAALWANTNYDAQPEKREARVRELENHFEAAYDRLHGGKEEQITDQEIADNPFFAAMKVPGEDLMDTTPEEAREAVEELDQT